MYSLPYIASFIFIILLVPFTSYDRKIQKLEVMEKYIYFCFVFVMFWGWGIVGFDALNYYVMYEETPKLFDFRFDYEREHLFYLLISICKTLGGDYNIFRIICSVIDFVVLYIFFDELLDKKLFPIAFIFYLLYGGLTYQIDFIRNSKAISCFLVSMIYFNRKKYFGFIFWNIIAFFFHMTSVFFPMAIIFYKLFLNKKVTLLLFITGCILSLIGIGLGTILKFIAPNVPGVLGHLLHIYATLDNYSRAHALSIGFIERFFVFILVFKFQDRIINEHKNLSVFISLFYIYIFLCFYFIDFTIIYERIAAMFKVSYWIVLPIIYSYLNKEKKYIFYFILFFYGILKIVQQYSLDVYGFRWELLGL